MDIPDLIQVNSSNIDVIGYDADKEKLFVGFKGQSGEMWAYSNVTEDTYKELMRATSIGKHFTQFIRNSHVAEKLFNIQGVWKVLK